MAERIQGSNCSRRRMTIPLSPVYRASEKDKDRGILEIFREKEGPSGRVQQGTRHKVAAGEEMKRR